MTRTRSMGVTAVAVHTAAGTRRSVSFISRFASSRTSREIYCGLVPQQPPNSFTPRSARSARLAANSSAVMS